MWRIYYSDGSIVSGETAEEWRAAPVDGVQVVVQFPKQQSQVRWYHPNVGLIRDRELWTGEDSYDPFGWGVKIGALIPDVDYYRIWERACGDN